MDADHDAYARIQHGAWLPGPRLHRLEPPRRWPGWLVAFLLGALVMFIVGQAWAIPACYAIAPVPFVGAPYGVGITPATCQGPADRFELDGADYWGRVHLEIPASSLWLHNGQPEGIHAPTLHYYLRLLTSYQGDVSIVSPDIYFTQWLLGSDWLPAAARWWHEHVGIPEWGPYVSPDSAPLTHTPEPSTLILLATAAVGIGLRVRRVK